MIARTLRLARPAADATLRWPAAVAGFGLLLGAAVAVGGLTIGLALVVLVVGAAALGSHPGAVLGLLAASMYFESLEVGGFTISRFIALAGIGLVVVDLTRRRGGLASGLPVLATIAYVSWLIASIYWAANPGKTASGVGHLAVSLLYTIAFAVLLRTRRSLDAALNGLAVGVLVTGVYAMLRFTEGSFDYSGRREGGFVGDPNFFAGYAIFAYPVLLALLSEARTLGRRAFLLLALFGVIGAVFTTLSRGGLIALTVVTLLVLLAPVRSLFASFGQKSLVALCIAAGVAVALSVSLGQLDTRVNSLLGGQEATGSGRVNFWMAAWNETKRHPFTGIGFGGFDLVSNELVKRTPGADLVHFDLREDGTLVHNVYLGSLAEVGVIGLVLYLVVVVSVGFQLRRVARVARARGDPALARLTNGLFLGLIGWSLVSIFISSETSRPLWILVGASVALPRLIARPGGEPEPVSAEDR